MDGVPKTIRTPTRDAGADTMAVLEAAGLTHQELAQMRAEGAI